MSRASILSFVGSCTEKNEYGAYSPRNGRFFRGTLMPRVKKNGGLHSKDDTTARPRGSGRGYVIFPGVCDSGDADDTGDDWDGPILKIVANAKARTIELYSYVCDTGAGKGKKETPAWDSMNVDDVSDDALPTVAAWVCLCAGATVASASAASDAGLSDFSAKMAECEALSGEKKKAESGSRGVLKTATRGDGGGEGKRRKPTASEEFETRIALLEDDNALLRDELLRTKQQLAVLEGKQIIADRKAAVQLQLNAVLARQKMVHNKLPEDLKTQVGFF